MGLCWQQAQAHAQVRTLARTLAQEPRLCVSAGAHAPVHVPRSRTRMHTRARRRVSHVTCGREAPLTRRVRRGRACPPGPHVGPLGMVSWLDQNQDPRFAGGETETWKGLSVGLRSPDGPVLGSGLELGVSHSEPLSGITRGPEPQSCQKVRGSSAL